MRFGKYWAFARIAARRQLSEPGELYGRTGYVLLILGVFSSLWHAVKAGGGLETSSDVLVWYLAITEWIVLSAPMLHNEIAEEVRRGDIAVQLPRPVSYVGAILAQGLGLLLVRLPLLGAAAFLGALALTGMVPSALALLQAVVLGALASFALTACYVVLGLLAFWLVDINPLHWIWQKCLFVLGGMLLPMSFYPNWFREFAALTPFPALLAGPASSLLASAEPAWLLALRLSSWTAFTILTAAWLFRRALRSLLTSGG